MIAGKRRTTIVQARRKTTIKDDSLYAINKHISGLQLNENARTASGAQLWERKSAGYRIVDLGLERFVEAIRFILDDFIETDPLCKLTDLADDVVSVRAYTQIIAGKMSEMRSVCAIEEGTQDLVGVLVASLEHFPEEQAQADIRVQGEALVRITGANDLVVSNGRRDAAFQAQTFLRIHVLNVDSKHRGRGVGTSLLRSCVALGSELSVFGCLGNFTSCAAQTIAERLGFESISEVLYEDLGLRAAEDAIHEDRDSGAHSITCMFLPITSMGA